MSLDELTFELERFEWQGDERLEIQGRWFGVRGQRFMRPTLHVKVDGRRRRMIALLDHKPWAPDAEGAWIAAFPWRGPVEPVTAARLEVSTDIVLELGAPGSSGGVTLVPRPRPKRVPPKPAVAPLPKPAPEPEPPPAPEPVVEASPPADLERRLAEETAARARLAAELELARRRLETQAGHHESAVDRANDLVRLEGELHAAETARDQATARADAAAAEALSRADQLAAAIERAERAEAELAATSDLTAALSAATQRAKAAEARAADFATRATFAEARAADLVAARDEATARADAAETHAAAPPPAATGAELAAAIERAERAEAERDEARADALAALSAPTDTGEELAAAVARAEHAEARAADLAASIRRGERAGPPVATELPPLPRRAPTRSTARHREWSATERIGVVAGLALVAIVLVVLLLSVI